MVLEIGIQNAISLEGYNSVVLSFITVNKTSHNSKLFAEIADTASCSERPPGALAGSPEGARSARPCTSTLQLMTDQALRI